MLTKFRSIARGIGSKILMGLLILTFGVWGVEDMVRKSGENTTVATVGDIEISYIEYQRELRRETDNLRQRFGKALTPEILKSLNIEPNVLQRMVDNRLLILESQKMGIRVSDEDIAKSIHKNQLLLDDKGKFSKKQFDGLLRSKGQTEKTFIQQLRDEMTVSLLLDSFTGAISTPENVAETLFSAREEQRKVEIYTVASSLISSIPAPSETQIKEYYDSHSSDFTAPEYRTISYVSITAEDAKKSNEFNKNDTAHKDIETAYHERIEEFKKPERRKIEQLLFANEDAARKAYDAIKSGKSFDEVAKTSNILNQKTISLGLVERANILEDAADSVFSMEVGASSEPIKSSFGWHIFHVKEILPAATQPLEEVRALLEKEFEQQAIEEALTNLSKKIDDAIAGGSTLSEAAKEFDLKTVTLPPIDKNGNGLDSAAEKSLPKYEKFLDTAFKTDEKTESALISEKNGVNYIVRVEKITPEHLLPLAEIKAKLISAWTTSEKKKQLAELAKKIAADFTKDSTRSVSIKTNSLPTPATLVVSQKKDADNKLPPAIITDIFSRPVGSATAAVEQKNGDEYIIAVVKEIIPVAANEKDSKYAANITNIHNEYKRTVQNEIIQQYLRHLAKKYPISVDLAVMQMKSDE
jgi:peptidyl-prolyl cis-trans isomerase D